MQSPENHWLINANGLKLPTPDGCRGKPALFLIRRRDIGQRGLPDSSGRRG